MKKSKVIQKILFWVFVFITAALLIGLIANETIIPSVSPSDSTDVVTDTDTSSDTSSDTGASSDTDIPSDTDVVTDISSDTDIPSDTDEPGDEDIVINNLGYPSWYSEGVTDTTSLVVLKDGDGNYITYPSYYIINNSASLNTAIDYSWLNEQTGKSYSAGSIYKIEIPNGITSISAGVFGTKDGGQSHSEPNVVEVVMPDSLTVLKDNSFRTAINLKKVVLSRYITTIPSYSFTGCFALEEIVFPDENRLESIGAAFNNCASLKEINLANCLKLKEIGTSAFEGCSSVGKVTLPDQLEIIGNKAFYNCTNMYFASDYLPSSLTSIGFNFMSGCKRFNETLVFPEGITQTDSYWFNDGCASSTGKLNLVFLGKITTLNLSSARFQGGYSGALNVYFMQNTSADVNGDIVEGRIVNGTLVYVAPVKEDGTGMEYTVKTDGTLDILLPNSVPNSSVYYGADDDGNALYRISDEAITLNFVSSSEKIYAVRNGLNGWRAPYLTTPFVSVDINE